jgi:hypothetical protein
MHEYWPTKATSCRRESESTTSSSPYTPAVCCPFSTSCTCCYTAALTSAGTLGHLNVFVASDDAVIDPYKVIALQRGRIRRRHGCRVWFGVPRGRIEAFTLLPNSEL